MRGGGLSPRIFLEVPALQSVKFRHWEFFW
nr:MAG TPA: hypothetical protein [Caudoviricetes sp.]